MSNDYNESRLLPYQVIAKATIGDADAINAVLRHFEGYILTLSTKQFYDEHGHSHFFVDEILRRRLETKLITKILRQHRATCAKGGNEKE